MVGLPATWQRLTRRQWGRLLWVALCFLAPGLTLFYQTVVCRPIIPQDTFVPFVASDGHKAFFEFTALDDAEYVAYSCYTYRFKNGPLRYADWGPSPDIYTISRLGDQEFEGKGKYRERVVAQFKAVKGEEYFVIGYLNDPTPEDLARQPYLFVGYSERAKLSVQIGTNMGFLFSGLLLALAGVGISREYRRVAQSPTGMQ